MFHNNQPHQELIELSSMTKVHVYLSPPQQQSPFITLYMFLSSCIFSMLFFIHFLRCWQGEFVYWSKASLLGDHFLHSHNLNVWFRCDIVRRNLMLVTYKVKGFKTPSHWTTKLKTIYLPNPLLIKEKMRRKRLAKWAR